MVEQSKTVNNNNNIAGTMILLFSVLMVIMLYWRWFLPGAITYGDWWYHTKGSMSDLTASIWGAGLGGYHVYSLSSAPLVMFVGFFFHNFGWDYSIIERLTCFFPLIFLLIFSPWYLARTLGYRRVGIATTIIVFNLNVYVFFITAVTNMALAIALGPLVIALFIQALQCANLRYTVLFTIVFALAMVYDMRIAYVIMALCGLYFIYHLIIYPPKNRYDFLKIGGKLFLMSSFIILLHSYMLIPFLFGRMSGTSFIALPEGYNNAGWVRTLSYWNLLHVLGLQVPWWGKSGIVNPPNPQFLLLPILAFSVFLLPVYKPKKMLLFFGIAALVFSFLAKGSKPPLGEVYIWLFLHFPGFFMFREPGKWWSPLIVSYAVLIGGLVNCLINRENINRFLNWVKKRLNISSPIAKLSLILISLGVFLVIFPVQPISALRYSSNFVSRSVPEESVHIEHFLHSQPNFFRVLWLPITYRFGYSSGQHPALSGVNLAASILFPFRFINPPDWPYISSYFGQPFSTFLLRLLSVKYVIVPSVLDYDPCIYYWYEKLPEEYYQLAEETPGIKLVPFKGKSQLYEVPDPFPHLYVASESIAVTGDDISIIPVISNVAPVNNAPLFLLINQIPEEIFKDIDGSIFLNTNWRDLTVDLCRKIEIEEFCKAPSGQSDKQKTEFKIEESKNYEIYLDTEYLSGPMLDGEIEIDKKERFPATGYQLQTTSRRYIKLGETELERGEHKIECKTQNTNFKVREQILKIILVSKEERERHKKFISQYINRPGNELSYSLSKNEKFHVSQESDYIVKAKVSPCIVRKKNKIGAEFSLGIEEELKDWSFRQLRVTYDYYINENKVLVLSSYFDGDGTDDEFVQMRNEKAKVDLEKYPYFDLTYRIEDPEVQTIEIVAGIDFDKDGKVDEYIRGIHPRPASVFWTNFSYNLYTKAKSDFPDKKYYELLHLEIYPHKLWRVDCSEKKKGKYTFWIKGLQFYNYYPEEFFEDFKDALDVNLSSKEERKKWIIKPKHEDSLLGTDADPSALPKPLTYLELTRPVDKIDLSQFSMIELGCKVKEPKLQNIEFILGLDFDGDTVIDKDISLDYLTASENWGKFNFDAYKLVKDLYPDKRTYNLMQIKLRLKGLEKINEEHPLYLKRLRVYSSSLVSPAGAVFDRPVFAIDGEEIRFKAKIKDDTDIENLRFEQTIVLEKGEHYLTKLDDGSFNVDWVIIEPAQKIQNSKIPDTIHLQRNYGASKIQNERPDITFKKINSTKYQVKVKGAKKPFWLVFNEIFHGQWYLYLKQKTENREQKTDEIVADYPKWGVKESKYKWRFNLGDIKYLFRKPLDAEHCLANMYANSWWVDPEKMNLPQDFNLVVFFWPQSLFCTGLTVSGLTFAGCLLYLGRGWIKKKRK